MANHEAGHVALFCEAADKMADDLIGVTATACACTPEKARELAEEWLDQQLGMVIIQRWTEYDAKQRAYDGQNPGPNLEHISCP